MAGEQEVVHDVRDNRYELAVFVHGEKQRKDRKRRIPDVGEYVIVQDLTLVFVIDEYVGGSK